MIGFWLTLLGLLQWLLPQFDGTAIGALIQQEIAYVLQQIVLLLGQ